MFAVAVSVPAVYSEFDGQQAAEVLEGVGQVEASAGDVDYAGFVPVCEGVVYGFCDLGQVGAVFDGEGFEGGRAGEDVFADRGGLDTGFGAARLEGLRIGGHGFLSFLNFFIFRARAVCM